MLGFILLKTFQNIWLYRCADAFKFSIFSGRNSFRLEHKQENCATSILCFVSFQRKLAQLQNLSVKKKASILLLTEFKLFTWCVLKIFFSNMSLYAKWFLLEHSLQDHFVVSLLILLCFSVEVQIVSIPMLLKDFLAENPFLFLLV